MNGRLCRFSLKTVYKQKREVQNIPKTCIGILRLNHLMKMLKVAVKSTNSCRDITETNL